MLPRSPRRLATEAITSVKNVRKQNLHSSASWRQASALDTSSFSRASHDGTISNLESTVESSTKSRFATHLAPFTTRVPYNVQQDDTNVQIKWTGLDLILHHADNVAAPTRISQWWLRDHCPCSTCMNQITKQRQVNNLNGSSAAPRIRNVNIPQGQSVIEIEWVDGHKSLYDKDFVSRKQSPVLNALRRGNTSLSLWDSSIVNKLPMVDHSQLQSGQYGKLMEKIRVYGFCLMDGVPPSPEASEAILEDIGPIRETHYGGFTVVTNDLTIKDTAYTSEALEPHNDNTYFSDAAGLQMLHLLSHERGSGGESLFVDGFAVAKQLHEEAPELYQALATYGIHAHASGNEGINLQPFDALPVLRHDAAGKELLQVRWNNADRAGVEAPQDQMDLWYEAASKFQELLSKESNRLWIQLKPGSPIIFDNWRLLHGRSEFTGIRTMCGGYIDRDYYISKFKTTNYTDAELVASVVSG